jgi:hypothetical protein
LLAKAKGKLGNQQPATGTDAKNFSFFLKMVLSSFQTQSYQNAEFHHDATRNFIHLILSRLAELAFPNHRNFCRFPPLSMPNPSPKSTEALGVRCSNHEQLSGLDMTASCGSLTI